MVTMTQANANLEAAKQAKIDIELKGQTLDAKTQFAEIMQLGAEYQKAEQAIGKAEQAIKHAEVEASKGERDTLSADVVKGLTARKTRIDQELRKAHLLLIATRSSDDSGFDDFQIKLGFNDEGAAMSEILHEMFAELGADGVSSAKRIRISLDDVQVDPVVQTRTPRASNAPSNGNGGGKGWSRDGVTISLQSAFDQSATADEVTHLGGLSGSNPTFSYKKKVVLAAGFTQ